MVNVKVDIGVSVFMRLLRSALWDEPLDWNGRTLNGEQMAQLTELATEQACTALLAQGVMRSGVRLSDNDPLLLFGQQRLVRERNRRMDVAVAAWCRHTAEAGIRICVVKGQTLSALYPDPTLRQSGDIDFLCHPADWTKAMNYLRMQLGVEVTDTNTMKHVEFELDGISYEMHSSLTDMAYPPHQRYWERVVMPEVLAGTATVRVAAYDVPTLPPMLNVLYTFEHIVHHLIFEGVGLRQCCDLALLLTKVQLHEESEVRALHSHLRGLGLERAFSAVCAMLVDHLGLQESCVPCSIDGRDHDEAARLFDNIIARGNFGHKVHYAQRRGVRHGLQHLMEIGGQAWRFRRMAPAECLWRIPSMLRWWCIKLARMARRGVR